MSGTQTNPAILRAREEVNRLEILSHVLMMASKDLGEYHQQCAIYEIAWQIEGGLCKIGEILGEADGAALDRA